MLKKWKRYQFLFEELVKRDFKAKYKGTVLGMLWSMLAPLLTLMVMSFVFTQFFGRNTPHYTIYLFAGNLVFSYFKESTNGGMVSLTSNSGIITKVNVPKYLFLFSKNVSSLINFGLNLVIFFIFVALDGIAFHWRFLMLAYPIVCLLLFNIGMGLVLSAMFVFFKDVRYLYDVFTLLLMYLSAIFYNVSAYSLPKQRLFLLNPLYVYIKYVRTIVIDGLIPSPQYHLLCLFYAVGMLLLGGWIYHKNNYKFLYYM